MAAEHMQGPFIELLAKRITEHLVEDASHIARAVAEKMFAELIGGTGAAPPNLPMAAPHSPAHGPTSPDAAPARRQGKGTPKYPGSAKELTQKILKAIPKDGATLGQLVAATGFAKPHVRARVKHLRQEKKILSKGTTAKTRYFLP